MSFQPTPLWNPASAAPPWNWNPAATFIDAYNSVQQSQREQEKAALDAMITRQLFPLKQKTAELELEKLMGEIELRKAQTDQERERTRAFYSTATTAVRSASPGNPQQQQISRFGPARYGVTTNTTPAPTSNQTSRPKPKWSVVQSAPTSTGP